MEMLIPSCLLLFGGYLAGTAWVMSGNSDVPLGFQFWAGLFFAVVGAVFGALLLRSTRKT